VLQRVEAGADGPQPRRRFSTNHVAIDAVTTPSSAIPATISVAATIRPSTVTG
jgi:hypothetical protein